MGHLVSPAGVKALQDALSGRYSLDLNGGEVRLICDTLPGRAVAAATLIDGVLWVVVDVDKPFATRSAWAMVANWRYEFFGNSVVPQPRREPCPLSLVS